MKRWILSITGLALVGLLLIVFASASSFADCVPDCTDIERGPDPICGFSCGTCEERPGAPEEIVCQDGICCPSCTGSLSFTDVLRDDGNYDLDVSWARVPYAERYEVWSCAWQEPCGTGPYGLPAICCDGAATYQRTVDAPTTFFTDTNDGSGFVPETWVAYKVIASREGCAGEYCGYYMDTHQFPTPTPTVIYLPNVSNDRIPNCGGYTVLDCWVYEPCSCLYECGGGPCAETYHCHTVEGPICWDGGDCDPPPCPPGTTCVDCSCVPLTSTIYLPCVYRKVTQTHLP